MQGGDVFRTLLSFLNKAIKEFPDVRNGTNTQYSMHDFAMSAFAVFFCQSPSFLAFQTLMQQSRGSNNGETMFGISGTVKIRADRRIAQNPNFLRQSWILHRVSSAFGTRSHRAPI